MGKAIIGVVGCGRSATAYFRAVLVSYVLGCVPLSWIDQILAREMMVMKFREVENEERRKDV